MADQADSMEEGLATGVPATPAAKRSPGHRAMDAREAAAEMAARAHEISLEAGSKMSGAMRDVINAAAGLAGFAVESARDLVQFMVRRGQMTQDEADRLIREAETASAAHRPAVAPRPAPQTSAPVRPPNAAVAPPQPAASAAAPSGPPSALATKTAKKAAESAPARPAKAEPAEKAAKSGKTGKAAPAAKEPGKAPAKAAAKAPAKSPAKAAAKAPAKSAAKAPAKTPAKTAAKSAKASKPAAKGSSASAKSAASRSAAANKKR